MKKLLLGILVLPLLVLAEEGELRVGGEVIAYDESSLTESGVLYYFNDELVASEHGAVLLVYKDDQVVMEAHDITGDGEFSTILTLDQSGAVVEVKGDGAEQFERPEVVELEELLAVDGGAGAPDDDLVGDLSSITIPKYRNYTFYIMTIVLLGSAYWWHRRKNGKEED